MIGVGALCTCFLLITWSTPTYASGITILGYGSRPSNPPQASTPEEVLANAGRIGPVDNEVSDLSGPPSAGGNKPAPGAATGEGDGVKPEELPPENRPEGPAPGGLTNGGPGGTGTGGEGMGLAGSGMNAGFAGPSPFTFRGPGPNVFDGFEFRGGFGGGASPGTGLPGAGTFRGSRLTPGEIPPPRPGGTGTPSGGPSGGGGPGAGAGGGASLSGGSLNGRGGPGPSMPPGGLPSGPGTAADVTGGPAAGLNRGGEGGRAGGSPAVSGGPGLGSQPGQPMDADLRELEREMREHMGESSAENFSPTGGPGGGEGFARITEVEGHEPDMTGGVLGVPPRGGPEGPGGEGSGRAGGGGWGGFNFGGSGGPIPNDFGGFTGAGRDFGGGEFGGGPSGGTGGFGGPPRAGAAIERRGGEGQPSAAGSSEREGTPSGGPSRRRTGPPIVTGGRRPQGMPRGRSTVVTLPRNLLRRILREEGFCNKDIAYLLRPKLLLSTRGKGLAVVLGRLAKMKPGSPFFRTRRRMAVAFVRRFLKAERGVRRVVISISRRFRRSAPSASGTLGTL